MTDAFLLYVTTPDQETARRIGRALVEEGLVACVNILRGMESLYRWQGTVEQAEECVLLIKASAGRVTQVSDRVRTLHPYDLPCILELPISGGNPPYIEWLVRAGC
ncbi:divalent-cation tolerance protein CutA [Niveispirillum sp. BGYR6]|uniref:divalent-cation tolerance protein CutA n=1 Tax=Niveispirillum sp. BGYR6 TaxID=2971249 RepID=UPI0022B9C9D4|nr:divalent-cation tolerance protein CutA [Niveispirillum sp. BGYR6]MDG5493802.1 divalent-cation tolerance protein CutA [Niveispirillum sp. BGYR6]